MTTQDQRSAATRERILMAATRVLSDQGYAAATMKTIAAEAGMSVGALQHQFAGKPKLMAAVTEQLLRSRVATYRRAIRAAPLDGGVAAMVGVTLEVMGDPTFLAMMEVALARRSDVDLHRDTQCAFDEAERLLGRWTARLWRRYGIPAEVAAIGRRLHSSLLTGLALRAAGGLEHDVTGLVEPWGRVLQRFADEPGLQALIAPKHGEPAPPVRRSASP